VVECIDHGKVGTGKGYAQKSRNNRMRYMHRLAYADFYGLAEISMGGVVLHSCDNPRCINPLHLSLGTHKDNTQDMLKKGRANPPRGTRCAQHVLTPEQVQLIREADGVQREIAIRFGISASQVSRIKGGKRWAQS
jgi:hypothetical protein